MKRKLLNIFWPYKDFDINKFKHYKDEDIAFVIQNQFQEHRRMFYHVCPLCNNKYKYEEYDGLISRMNDPLICKNCGNKLENNSKDIVESEFISGSKEFFTSIWMHVLVQRYYQKLCTFCPEDEDKFQDYLMAFFRAVLSYNNSEYSGKVKFNTFFWRVIHNEACDDGREKSSPKKNPSIMCMVCGENVGKISADHLMNLSGNLFEGKDGFMGHGEFIKRVENIYINSMSGSSQKMQRSIIRKKITSEYHHSFPHSPMEGKNVSLDDQLSPGDDNELCRKDTIACNKEDPIIFDDNAFVYSDMVFSNGDVEFIINNFPELYNIAVCDKKIHNISRKYDSFEKVHATQSALKKMSKLIARDFCNTERGYTRKSIFYDHGGNLVNEDIIYDILDLHSHNYNIDTISSFIGHDNMEKDDIKMIFRLLSKNPECMEIAEEYLEPVVNL